MLLNLRPLFCCPKLAKGVETFHQWPLAASVDRHAADRESVGRRLAKLFGKGEKIPWLVRFERDDVFLFAEPKGVS